MSMTRFRTPLVASIALAAFAVAAPVFAGPPLLCHPFDIGQAASLPWGGGTWFAGQPGYDTSRLVADTSQLLGPTTPVIVRMETLRRAVIYAGHDQRLAADLLKSVTTRAQAASGKSHAALAYLDAAYVIEALRQVAMLTSHPEFGKSAAGIAALVKNLDGYAVMRKGLLVAPGDPSLEFAAALIALQEHSAESPAHAQRARAGAGKDPLLTKNLKQLG